MVRACARSPPHREVGVRGVAAPGTDARFQHGLGRLEPNRAERHARGLRHGFDRLALRGLAVDGIGDDGAAGGEQDAGTIRDPGEDAGRVLGRVGLGRQAFGGLLAEQTLADDVAAQDHRPRHGAERRGERLCHARLAGTGAAGHDEQARRHGLEGLPGESEISTGLLDLGRPRLAAQHAGVEARHLRPDRRAHRKEQRQKSEARVVLGAIMVGLEQRARVRGQAAPDQVHDQEGEVVEHVDAGELLVELEAVEQNRPALEEHDVGEVQIAVAVPHPAVGTALVEKVGSCLELSLRGRVQRCDRGRVEDGGCEAREIAGIALDDRPHRRVAALVAADLGLGVETADLDRQRLDQVRAQLASCRDPVELGVLRETGHLEQPFDRLARPAERQAAVGLARDRDDAAVELGRRAPVQGELGLECRLAPRERGEVHEAEAHRALHLPGALPGEEDDRTVRVDALDAPAQSAAGKKGQDLGLPVVRHRSSVVRDLAAAGRSSAGGAGDEAGTVGRRDARGATPPSIRLLRGRSRRRLPSAMPRTTPWNGISHRTPHQRSGQAWISVGASSISSATRRSCA